MAELSDKVETYEVWEQRGGFAPVRFRTGFGNPFSAALSLAAAGLKTAFDRSEAAPKRYFLVKATTTFEEVTHDDDAGSRG